jgi:hypothetical protein
MDYLSEKDLSTFFEKNNNHYVNSAGMLIGLSEEWGIWTHFDQGIYGESEMSVSIITEGDSLHEFIVGFRIESWKDIDQLDYNNSWMRYLNGEAEIVVNPSEFDADIFFRINKFKTIIFSMDLHFYDEVYEHLTMPEDFQKYVDDHENRLWVANENRHKLSRR